MRSVFISHSSKDDRYAAEMEQLLRGLGFESVFNDAHSIRVDENFWKRIVRFIENCDIFVVILSQDSVASDWVNRELELARDNDKQIIPVIVEDCELPASLQQRHCINLRRPSEKFGLSRLAQLVPGKLFGRDEWLNELDAVWNSRKTYVYALIGWSGSGKTSIVASWIINRLVARRWRGVERYFEWSFANQGAHSLNEPSAEQFITDALAFFDDRNPQIGGPRERGERLAERIRQYRTLLVLDGIELMQYPPDSPQAGEFRDDALAGLLHGLSEGQNGLCVITSCEKLVMPQALHGDQRAVLQRSLEGLPKEAGVAMLRDLDVAGTAEEYADTWREVGGHAMTLRLLGNFLVDAHRRDIRSRTEINLIEADRETPEKAATKTLSAYEAWLSSAGSDCQLSLAVLRLMGLFDHSASADCLQALREPPAIAGLTDKIVGLAPGKWEKKLDELSSRGLITLIRNADHDSAQNPPLVGTHPLIRAYFADQLLKRKPGESREAHSRIFDHLSKVTEYRPDNLSSLQRLLQAIAHGCHAGRVQEARANFERILRDNRSRSITLKLRANGARLAACTAFFRRPWSELLPGLGTEDEAWLLRETALSLKAFGRIDEAVAPMTAALQRLAPTNWRKASIYIATLRRLKWSLGDLDEAIALGNRLHNCLVQSGKDVSPARNSSRHLASSAAVLHQAGRWREAGALFAEAEASITPRKDRPDWLYARAGFYYVEFILAPAERHIWRMIDDPPLYTAPQNISDACVEAEQRSRRSILHAGKHYPPLFVGLDSVNCARSLAYRAILDQPSSPHSSACCQPAIEACQIARDKLREASYSIFWLQALFISAFQERLLSGRPDLAHRYLEEAEIIAKRGPMPLRLADTYLYRARLLHDKDALAAARPLIEKHGYWRRREELEDAEKAAAGW
jgi:tetratricopeptide (TPR) repeat protein